MKINHVMDKNKWKEGTLLVSTLLYRWTGRAGLLKKRIMLCAIVLRDIYYHINASNH